MEFEWDPQKGIANLKKHGASFHEAVEAFLDENAVELYGDLRSDEKMRFQIIGISKSRLLLCWLHSSRRGY